MKSKTKPSNQPKRTPDVTKYNPSLHDKSILEHLSQGGFPQDFCREWGIGRKTYYNWKKMHPSFKEAESLGMHHGAAIWLRKPMDRQENAFSHQYWALIMKNIYGWGREKALPLAKEMHPRKMLDTTIDLLAKGRISDKMAERFNSLAMSKLRIMETEELEQRIKNLEHAASKK